MRRWSLSEAAHVRVLGFWLTGVTDDFPSVITLQMHLTRRGKKAKATPITIAIAEERGRITSGPA
jgi:hypothetical protein